MLGREHERPLKSCVCKKSIDTGMAVKRDRICIVESGSTKLTVADRKAQRLDQMQFSTRIGA